MPEASHRASSPAPNRQAHAISLPGRLNGTSDIEIVFIGDTAFGESYEAGRAQRGLEPILKERDYSSFLDGVRNLVAGADFSIVNLETPLTDASSSPYEGRKRYIHRGDGLQTVEALREIGIRAVSLANNHAVDYGRKGLEDTLDLLSRNHISTIGAGRSTLDATRPLLLDLHGQHGTSHLAIVAAYDVRQSLEGFYENELDGCAMNRVQQDGLVDQIADLRRHNPGLYITAFIHWGRNYMGVTARQRRLAADMCRAGARLIIGHGAHTIQEVERIGSAWVVYSLGNFVFNSPGRFDYFKADPFGFVARLLIRPGRDEPRALRLHPILTNNRVTGYEPRPVGPQSVATIARKYGLDGARDVRVKANHRFIELRIASSKRRRNYTRKVEP